MKLWLLQARHDLPGSDDPWAFPYDVAGGFVVRAETEESARQMVRGGDEVTKERNPWADARYTSCVELTADGGPDVILTDFRAA